MSFCPKWLFEAACGAAAADFVSQNVNLATVALSYAEFLFMNQFRREFSEFISSALQFLDELDAGEAAVPMLVGFTYNR